ncbi:carboxymuconolactone decarboxylase family protein [Mucilaginibacter sp. KACC 22063]|uniref:carboxymuconolactone decarboxylase family protein n=1 Tax=Mucilaginibacter sp. KACC 22063 TaxID=3025666 RepID=UPI0023673515|nr:carboxymuconolactone decarboxylase family protein [Mucilaginibacter sp. KACC 22063]WDF56941.1 carboxymuconolactone decarboxylase family protein [Mucilaginibacter sp. KACC 22063]
MSRIKIDQVEPAAYKAMYALENYLKTTGIDPRHKELIKIRASQINGCAFCIDMHTKDARKLGETEQRIYALNAWRETPFFDEQERALLALTEAVTLISSNHVPDEVWNKAAAVFDEVYLSQMIMAIATINAWNRIAISTRMEPAL